LDISLSLSPELVGIVEAKIESGRFASASDVIREALRLLETEERMERNRSRYLRDAWREGVESGDAGPLDFASLREEARRGLAIRNT
jgi:antitoxin ParD1/3/4